ncbi:MAG TPA: hypothetical protein VK456_02420 [Xanthobacteraceae bacterium]|nr:hypothetical protein [Xanthobacteraceae bacterium]
MVLTSAREVGALRAMLFATTLAIAATEALSQSLVGNGFSPADDPVSPYYLGQIAPPSWQGRPLAIPNLGGLGE